MKKNWLMIFVPKILFVILGGIIVFIPLTPVFSLSNFFNVDWYHNLWFIGYFEEFFRQHHSFPLVFNTNSITNISIPLFYGYMLYPLLGLVSHLLGPNITLRLILILVSIVQLFIVYILVRRITRDKWLGLGISSLTLWSTYQLTNLYNRSALAEFIAVTLLVISICVWFYASQFDDIKQRCLLRILFSLCLIFCIGSHPITGLYGGLFAGFIVLLHLFFDNKSRSFRFELISTFLIGVFLLIVTLPWLYVTLKFSDQMQISHTGIQQLIFYDGIDDFWLRLLPFPYDPNSVGFDITGIQTPYLETQINIPLLFFMISELILALVIQKKKKLIIRESTGDRYAASVFYFSIVCLVFFFLISVFPTLERPFDTVLSRAQFAYRFVSYQNLSILTAIISLTIILKDRIPNFFGKRSLKVILALCILLSLTSLSIKLDHANQMVNVFVNNESEGMNFLLGYGSGKENKDNLLNIPHTLESAFDYSTAFVSFSKGEEVNHSSVVLVEDIEVGKGKDFGILMPITLNLEKPSWVAINTVPFPWMHIYVNNELFSCNETFLYENHLYFQLAKGEFIINVVFEADQFYKLASLLSFVSVALCACYLLVSIRSLKKAFVE